MSQRFIIWPKHIEWGIVFCKELYLFSMSDSDEGATKDAHELSTVMFLSGGYNYVLILCQTNSSLTKWGVWTFGSKYLVKQL